MEKLRLDELSDEGVLEGVSLLVRRSNEITAELLAYLAEVETRGLHLKEATGSLFAYCVERLHMAEAAAGKRITAARTARRFPLALEMIARGEIHLTGLNLLGPLLTEENHAELLARARHLSKRAIEKLIAEIAPRPDVPSRVVALPMRIAAAPGGAVAGTEPAGMAAGEDCAQEVHSPERVVGARVPPPALVAPLSSRAAVEPLSPRRYQIRVTVDEETHRALCQLQDLLSHQVPDRDPAVIIARALELLLERTLARKAAVTERPRTGKAPEKRTRHIPAAVRREVWKRDAGRCAYLDSHGRRCSSTRLLEFHHRENWARGADHDPDGIELRCRAHNQFQAQLDYGAEFMAARRSSTASGAREPRRLYLAGGARRVAAETASKRLEWRCGERAKVDRAPARAASGRLLGATAGGFARPGERGPPRRAGAAAADRGRGPAGPRAPGPGGDKGRPSHPRTRAGDSVGRVAVEPER